MLAEYSGGFGRFFILPVKILTAPQDLREQGNRPVVMARIYGFPVWGLHLVFRLI